MEDPLLTKSQIIRDFEVLLKESSTFPNFIEFLQACEIDHYAECWIECDKFRALALSLLRKYKETEVKNVQNLPCTSTNLCRTPKKRNSKNSLNRNQNSEEEKNIHILPDLVSNIPNNVSITPLPSPEEPNSIKTNENQSSDEVTNISHDFKISESPTSTNDLNGNLGKLPENEMNANLSVHFDNLKERLVGFALQIYNKFLDVNCDRYIDLPESLRSYILDNISNCEIDCGIFTPIQKFIFTFLEREYFPKYLDSGYFLKQIVEVFTSQHVLLQDILSCDSAMPYFMEYLEQEGGQALLEFWISAFNFKQHLQKQQGSKTYNPEEAQADAMVLYDKYFSLQATHKLGFSDQVRFMVECNICQETGPSPECFDVPLRIVFSVIQREFLCGYISSALHIKFVSELVNTMGRKKRSASGSTCLSEESVSTNKSSGRPASSISQTNTLLAMDSSGTKYASGTNANKFFKHFDDPSLAMRIDATQILDPDSLWRRKNFTKLSCGFVDELGRFESDLQPEPDRKNESKFSKTLRRFVKLEENKVKEDMAYKVAEMIIKDVTSVTLGEPHCPRRGSSTRPFSCTEEQLGRLNSDQRLQRSPSEFFKGHQRSESQGLPFRL